MVHREKLIKAFYVISEMINIKNFLETHFQQKKIIFSANIGKFALIFKEA